ncbi:hypothetical protein ABBQ38_006259 [Trebouxia sp. C0009 RCD-2024]
MQALTVCGESTSDLPVSRSLIAEGHSQLGDAFAASSECKHIYYCINRQCSPPAPQALYRVGSCATAGDCANLQTPDAVCNAAFMCMYGATAGAGCKSNASGHWRCLWCQSGRPIFYHCMWASRHLQEQCLCQGVRQHIMLDTK